MAIIKGLRSAAVVSVLCFASGFTSGSAWADCPHYGGKFEPADGTILHIVGQTDKYEDSYIAGTGIDPAGSMSYRVISAYYDGELIRQQQHPNTVWQVGLNFPGGNADLDKVAAGSYDVQITALGVALQNAKRPVYLRIGYEFEGNGYAPAKYVAAFQRIVNRLRFQGVTNVAFVWHALAGGSIHDFSAWYPGDSYVDWAAVSLFWQARPNGDLSGADAMADFASAHGKPLMIAESTPNGYITSTQNGNTLWNDWYVHVINFIGTHGVKAWSYINDNWSEINMFKPPTEPPHLKLSVPRWPGWGDARIEANNDLKAHWLAELGLPKYLKASPTLFCNSLGYPSTTSYDAVDEMSDFSNILAHSVNLQIDHATPEQFNGDSARLKRTKAGQEFAIWRTPKLASLSAIGYSWGGDTSANFQFSASSDGVTFTPLATAVTNLGGEWLRVRYTASVPANTSYVKVTFPKVSAQVWTPQLGQVTFTFNP